MNIVPDPELLVFMSDSGVLFFHGLGPAPPSVRSHTLIF